MAKKMICKKCKIECDYYEPKVKKSMVLNHKSYYSYRFKCPICKTWYYPKEALVTYSDQIQKYKGFSAGILEKLKDSYESPKKKGKKWMTTVIWTFRQYYLDHPEAYFNQQEKLAALQYIASLKFPLNRELKETRAQYNDKKQTESWKPHINDDNCFVCFGKAEIRHHMVQLQNGGQNSYNNLITLCNKCHADVHPWLKK